MIFITTYRLPLLKSIIHTFIVKTIMYKKTFFKCSDIWGNCSTKKPFFFKENHLPHIPFSSTNRRHSCIEIVDVVKLFKHLEKIENCGKTEISNEINNSS